MPVPANITPTHINVLRTVAVGLALHMSGEWATIFDPAFPNRVTLERGDGLTIRLRWRDWEERAEACPVAPVVPGESFGSTAGLKATFDPTRPVATIARQVERAVVKSWEPLLADRLRQNELTMTKRRQAQNLYCMVAAQMGDTPNGDLLRALETGETVTLYPDAQGVRYTSLEIGPFGMEVKLTIEDSDAANRVAWFLTSPAR